MTARAMLLSDEEIASAFNKHDALFNPFAAAGLQRMRDIRDLYEADRAKLLDEIERMKAAVPRWVNTNDRAVLKNLKWMECCAAENLTGPGYLWLMVPPIPPPEKHEEKGREIG